MKNPLNKRLLRELAGDFSKYLVVFILLAASIGFVSGFLVADGSMIAAYDESFEKYRIEDGNFCTQSELDAAEISAIEEAGVKLYPNFYADQETDGGSTVRIFQNRQEVDLVCLMQGRMPEAADEIAIDRMFAENNGLEPGDTLAFSDREMKISGLVALSDYSALFSDNNDMMFDAVKFGVSVVTREGFEALEREHIKYSYSWIYEEAPKDENEEKEKAEALLKTVMENASLQAFIPRFLNQAIQFTGEDMGSDKAMMTMLLYIIIVILAFVFGVTISNTIAREAGVIGTLRASGYTKGELVRHYMAMPLLVTLLGAVVGNILGYTVFRLVCVGMYYGSYSLPTYTTIWNAEAFVMTTAVPLLLMLVITFGILYHKLSLTPLQFIRRDLKKNRRRKTLRLSRGIPFFSRFRIRIVLQNISSYITLFVGIIFANLLLMFGLLFPSLLHHFQTEIMENMLCRYQYVLQAPLEMADADNVLEYLLAAARMKAGTATQNEDAEPYSVYALKTVDDRIESEQVSIYGVLSGSRYVPLQFSGEGVYVSEGYAEKYGLKAGDTVTLKEPYGDGEYELEVAGMFSYPAALAIFMEQEQFNETFGYGEGYFNGYFSDTEITDMDDKYIASRIDEEDLTKLTRQLDVSMGSMMYMVDGFAVAIFIVVLYLLTKIVIEKNEQSISMVKILGYRNSEISRLYIMSTTMVVSVCVLLSLPINDIIMKRLFIFIMVDMMPGWLTYYVAPSVYIKIILASITTYAVVASLEYRRICRVPMSEALKNVE
ncbi:MAG: ABC transporter permease [Lachnospiraceae bacterium]|nr:ABC transporter permease [Lachnospiraceae bacterium]